MAAKRAVQAQSDAPSGRAVWNFRAQFLQFKQRRTVFHARCLSSVTVLESTAPSALGRYGDVFLGLAAQAIISSALRAISAWSPDCRRPRPRSTAKTWPVIQSAAGSASEMIQLETSFGWQRRPKGMRSLSWRLTASACSVESPIMGGRSRTNADNGPKGQENIAQALAWVGQRKDVKPCKGGRTHAPINFRHSICQKERYVVSHFRSASSRPYRAITVGGELPRLEAWAKFPRPFGPKPPPRDRTTHGGRRMIAPKHCRQTR